MVSARRWRRSRAARSTTTIGTSGSTLRENSSNDICESGGQTVTPGNRSLVSRIAVGGILVVMAACGGSSPNGPSGGSGSSVIVRSTGSAGAVGATITIGANGAVSPTQVSVAVGQSVTFTNNIRSRTTWNPIRIRRTRTARRSQTWACCSQANRRRRSASPTAGAAGTTITTIRGIRTCKAESSCSRSFEAGPEPHDSWRAARTAGARLRRFLSSHVAIQTAGLR